MKRFLPTALAFPLLALSLAGGAHAATVIPASGTLVHYSIDTGNEFAPSSAGDGLAASVLGTGASLADVEAGVALQGAIFLNPTVDSPTVAAARANGQYFEFTLTSPSGNVFEPQTLTFSAGNGGASTPRGYAIYSSLDGFTTAISSGDIITVQPTLTPFSVNLTGFNLSSDPVTFRFYAYSPGAGQGVFVDDISVTGLIAIPEGSTMALAGLAGAALVLRRRRI